MSKLAEHSEHYFARPKQATLPRPGAEIPESEMDDGHKHGWTDDGYPDTPKYRYGGEDVRIVYDRKQAEAEKKKAKEQERATKRRERHQIPLSQREMRYGAAR